MDIINKKYDFGDAYVRYIGVNNLIVNDLIDNLKKGIINENEIINTLIEKNSPSLLTTFCIHMKISDEYLINKILNFLNINKYYTILIELCNGIKDIPEKKVEDIILSTNNVQIICNFAINIKNDKSKNKAIDYVIENGNTKDLIYLLNGLINPPYKKIFKKLKKLPNGLDAIFILAIEYSFHQSYAIDEILDTNDERMIKDLYEKINVYTDYKLIEKIKLKIREIEKKYIPKKPNYLSEIMTLVLKQDYLTELHNMPERMQIINLQKCLNDIHNLVSQKINDKTFLEIINTYYEMKVVDIIKLYSILLGTTKIKKETKPMHSRCFFSKSLKQVGIKESIVRTSGVTLRQSPASISKALSIDFDVIDETFYSIDPIVYFEPYKFEVKKDLYNFYTTEIYEALITYYAVEKFEYPNVSSLFNIEGLGIDKIKELIKSKRLIVTGIERGKYIRKYNTDDVYDNSKMLNNFNELILDRNIPTSYALSIMPLLKEIITKEKIEKDISFIINYLKQQNERNYNFMIANYLVENSNYYEVNKILKKSIK